MAKHRRLLNACEIDRLAHHRQAAEAPAVDMPHSPKMLNLWVGEDAIDAVNRTTWHARGVEAFDPLGRGSRRDDGGNFGVQFGAIVRTQLVGGELRLVEKMLGADRLAESGEQIVADGS